MFAKGSPTSIFCGVMDSVLMMSMGSDLWGSFSSVGVFSFFVADSVEVGSLVRGSFAVGIVAESFSSEAGSVASFSSSFGFLFPLGPSLGPSSSPFVIPSGCFASCFTPFATAPSPPG